MSATCTDTTFTQNGNMYTMYTVRALGDRTAIWIGALKMTDMKMQDMKMQDMQMQSRKLAQKRQTSVSE